MNNLLYRSLLIVLTVSSLDATGFVTTINAACQDNAQTQSPTDAVDHILAEHQKMLDEFNGNPTANADEKKDQVQRIVDIERQVNQKIAEDPAFANLKNSVFQQNSISNAKYLISLMEPSQNFGEIAELRQYLLPLTQTIYGSDHQKSIEAAIELDQARWLAAAKPEELKQYQASRVEFEAGTQAVGSQQWEEGKTKLQLSKQTLEELGLQDKLAYGETVANLAEAYWGLGNRSEAESAFQLAIETNDRLFQQGSRTNASMRISFARIYHASQETEKVQKLMNEALEITRSTIDPPTLETAVLFFSIGDNYQRIGQTENAIAAYHESFVMTRQVSNGDPATSRQILNALTNRLSQLQQFKDVAEAHRLQAQLDGQLAPANPALVAQSWINAANADLKADDHDTAIADLASVQPLIDQLYTVSTEDSVAVLRQYSQVLSGVKQHELAIEVIQKATTMASDVAGKDSLLYITCVQNHSIFLGQVNRIKESDQVLASIFPWLEKNLGEGHAEFQNILRDRAITLQRAELWSDAAEQWKRLIRILEANEKTKEWLYEDAVKNMIEIANKTADEKTLKEYSGKLEQ